MTHKSLALISDNESIISSVTKAVDRLEDHSLETLTGTLSSVNGHASQLLNNNDLLVFTLSEDVDMEIVSDLRRSAGPSATILALSDRDISLSDARALNKVGVDEILPFPIGSEELREQIQKLTVDKSLLPAIYNPQKQRLGQVISVCPARGGIGASTLTINLADQLQGYSGIFRKKTQNKVAIVDLDLQFGTVATALDLEPSSGLLRMAQQGVNPDRTFLQQSLVQHASGLEVLSAPEDFMPLDALTREQVTTLIETLRHDFDYVVIDLPRILVDWIGAVVTASDRMFMIGDSSVSSVRQSCRLIDFFTKERLAPPVEIVFSREAKPTFRSSHHVEAQKALGRELRHWLPCDARHAKQALDRGQLLSQSANNCALSKSIRMMGRKIMSETSGEAKDLKNNAA
ncbi:AAA family ATPase [Ruegeria arenilitoris]|uniref:AAA family ATPase n=1 Tax=Ruegeria arenilitoris TaxID=1173585 RepID=UPI001480D2FD|nr:AAA family ATPase [Ruegeria arenilitoris]